MTRQMRKKGMEAYMIIGMILAILVIVAVLAIFTDNSSTIIDFFKRL
ncbi:MAG: hypothetical protein ACLFO2_00505 [Candidatus Woesearchaeota archaeon]